MLAYAGSARAGAAAPDSSRTMFRRTVSFTALEGRTAYQLPDPFIVYHTERIETGGRRLVRGEDYRIDYDSGILTLTRALSAGTPLLIRYERFPAPLRRRYAHRRRVIERTLPDSLPAPVGPARTAARTSEDTPFGAFPSTLKVTGSKTFSVLTGSNRDASLEQSLRIRISGKAAPDVDVVAILSDQSSPIQPEGNTQTLQELDNVFVQVRTPHVTTTMGDYNLTLNKTAFARYDRKLKGAQSALSLPNGSSFQVAVAISKGKFTSRAFQGVEGNQGPYQLTNENGSDDIIVIAGTEKVWIDGIRMTRGEDNDYTIDYTTAQVTFTRHRIITSESRIVVDFEAADQQFQRNLYAGRGEFALGRHTKLGATFIREGDDRNNPASVSLSPEDITALKKVNGEAGQAQIPGAEFVGEGRGSYALERDDENESNFFRYTGPNGGAYDVSFSQVALGQGAYVPGEQGGFRYVGPNEGNYVPQVFLPLPTSHSLFGFDVRAKPTQTLTVTGEVAVSNRNLNTFAEGADKHTKAGSAFLLKTGWTPHPLHLGGRSFGRFEMTGTYRAVQNAFRPVGRIDAAEYDRRYDQGQSESWRGNVIEMAAVHHLNDALSIGGGFGRLTRPDGFSSRRRDVRLSATPHGLPHVRYQYEIIRSNARSTLSASGTNAIPSSAALDNRWVRQKASAEYSVWHLRPRVGIEDERRRQRADGALHSGRNFTEFTAGIGTTGRRRLTFSSELAYRTAAVVGPRTDGTRGWLDESTGRTLRNRVALHDWRSLSASAEVIRRSKTFKEAAGQSNKESLIDGKVRFAPWRRALSVDARYEINNTRSSRTSRRYMLVGRGRGNLRLDTDSGEFVPDPEGEYVVRYDRVGDFEPVTGIKSTLRLQTAPYKHLAPAPGVLNALLRNIRTDTYFAVEERTRAKNKRALYLLQLSKFQQDSTTVAGDLTIRQDVFLFPQRRKLSVRLRYERRSTLNNQFITGGERRFREEQSLRVRMPVAPRTTGEMLFAHKTKRRTDIGRERFRIQSYSGEVSMAHRPTPPLELLVRLNAVRDHDSLNDVRATLIGLAPRLTYSFRRKGRARFGFDWASVHAAPARTFLPFEMVRGRRVGQSARWRGGVDYRISRYVSFFMQYDGRLDPGRPTVHTARAEMRAFF